MTVATMCSLFIGVSFGFLAQRSRFCFVAGLRDYFLIKDKKTLIGIATFLATAWLGICCLWLFNGSLMRITSLPGLEMILLSGVGGFFVGFISVLVNGCPLRQHVLAASGHIDSIYYLIGFILGAVIFDVYTLPFLLQLLP